MKQIALNNTLPRVFAGHHGIHSDVWLQDIGLERGKRYLISAESGTGKSSMCSYIYGYRQDYSGAITFDGQDIRSLTIDQWCEVRQRHIAYLPQDMRLFGELTAMENVELKNRLTQFKSASEIGHLFEALGIADKQNSLASKLSIGQQQRVAIIRTLCQPCDFILLDEPVSHLDEENNRTVAEIIVKEAERQGAGIIATSVGNHLRMEVDQVFNL
ncbi:MAG: ATP-binding cassette domain-containing protein [Muribaculaceae bacterium]|jgi:ABC-type lipoprotein export system ATPase subunit|nr:ATP-binding cassette domain-containing protein [Muribaculaceae bacterium]